MHYPEIHISAMENILKLKNEAEDDRKIVYSFGWMTYLKVATSL